METKKTNNIDDINALIKPYLDKWYWFLIGGIIALIMGVFYIKIATPAYKVSGAVLIKDSKKSLGIDGVGDMGVLEGLSGIGGMSTNSIENEVEIFKSKKLVRDIVKNYHLQTVIHSKEGLKEKELFGDTSPINVYIVSEKKNKKFPKKKFLLSYNSNGVHLESKEYSIDRDYPYDKVISLPFANIIISKNSKFDKEKAEDISEKLELKFYALEAQASNIRKLIQVDLADKDATIINLSMDYPQVDKATTILTALIDAYNRDAILDKNLQAQRSKVFIDDRINKISKELDVVENDKERFKSDNQISDILTEVKINLESTAEAKKKQLELDAQLGLTNELISYLRQQKDYQVLPTNIGLNNVEANSAIDNYNKMVLERNRLLESATPQNPLVVELNKQIQSMRGAVAESLQKNKTALQLALNEYGREQSKLSSRISKIPYQEKLFRSLERQQQIKESLYLLLLQKREETAISLAVVAPKARVVEPVYVSDKPVSPKKLLVLFLSLIFGLLIPFAIIYIKDLFNNKIVHKNDIRNLTEIPVIAELPALKKNAKMHVEPNDYSSLADAFRILVTNMNFLLNKALPSKVVYVTSTIKGEGKTFVSMNLSSILANTNKVIVIGADIRNPQLQRYDIKSKNLRGLSEYLYDKTISHEDIIVPNPINAKCDLIYSGIIPPNPTELLKNGRFEVLLEILKEKYEYIIVDTAPLLLVTDTLTISQYADLVLYVMRSNYTQKNMVDFINELVDSKKIENVGIVINDVQHHNFSYGNKYGYGYNNK